MNYLVIDLEMCKVPKNYRGKNYKYASEIIQVGAVLLDEEYKEIGTLCQYVHPEFGILDYFITNLTGMRKADKECTEAERCTYSYGRLAWRAGI